MLVVTLSINNEFTDAAITRISPIDKSLVAEVSQFSLTKFLLLLI